MWNHRGINDYNFYGGFLANPWSRFPPMYYYVPWRIRMWGKISSWLNQQRFLIGAWFLQPEIKYMKQQAKEIYRKANQTSRDYNEAQEAENKTRNERAEKEKNKAKRKVIQKLTDDISRLTRARVEYDDLKGQAWSKRFVAQTFIMIFGLRDRDIDPKEEIN